MHKLRQNYSQLLFTNLIYRSEYGLALGHITTPYIAYLLLPCHYSSLLLSLIQPHLTLFLYYFVSYTAVFYVVSP